MGEMPTLCDFLSEESRSMSRKISLEEVRKHKQRGDLWVAIQGRVVDVTQWVDIHPGGDLPLINLAGEDITDIFVAYHPTSAWKYLDRFFVGYLDQEDVLEETKDYRLLLKELQSAGMFEASLDFYYKIAAFIVAMLAFCVAGVLFSQSFWVHIGSAVLLGLVWMQSGFIGHDSAHKGLLKSRRLEVCVQLLVGNALTGISIGWWKRSHNVHHTSVNNLEYDPDLQYMPLFAVSARFFRNLYSKFYERKMDFDAVARFLVRYQHWTFYPVMAVARVLLFMHSLALLFSRKKVAHRRWEIVAIAAFWVWFGLLVSCLPSWGERTAFVFASFLVSGIQHVQFCLNHFSSHVFVGHPSGKTWFPSQIRGTLDIECSPWMDWFHGGLQFQVEHHCFPRVPRQNLRKLVGFLKPLCEKHNLPYKSASFWEANAMLMRTLRGAALEARDLANPLPKNLVWEAVNTHG